MRRRTVLHLLLRALTHSSCAAPPPRRTESGCRARTCPASRVRSYTPSRAHATTLVLGAHPCRAARLPPSCRYRATRNGYVTCTNGALRANSAHRCPGSPPDTPLATEHSQSASRCRSRMCGVRLKSTSSPLPSSNMLNSTLISVVATARRRGTFHHRTRCAAQCPRLPHTCTSQTAPCARIIKAEWHLWRDPPL